MQHTTDISLAMFNTFNKFLEQKPTNFKNKSVFMFNSPGRNSPQTSLDSKSKSNFSLFVLFFFELKKKMLKDLIKIHNTFNSYI